MAVYQQTYRPYTGPLTPAAPRFLILYQQARRSLFQSKLLLGFFVVCFLIPLLELVTIYISHNPAFFHLLGLPRFIAINRSFFFTYVHYQCFMAFLFTAFAAPGLIAPDLADGGLALYLSRPFSRAEYLAGKIAVLWLLLSALTWVPGLILFGVQSDMGGAAWRQANGWLGWSIVLACAVWIVVWSLLALAISAWVKWRVVAGAVLLGIYFFGAGFAQVINLVLGTQYGSLVDLMEVHLIAWSGLFRRPAPPLGLYLAAWAVLAAIAAGSLWMILKKVRPLEVIK
ncbi:MAG TPA: ABC transporter permease subunit [Terriglobales bacterium]|jgi:ABC-2 type transport system permease protein